ncbi:MAG: phosphate ABC transporter permease PstA [Verrucomicrobia bacterium]|nr:phosphate ABC transporter permease PstA [Verrucomicrobiota bacterium]
MSASLHPFRSHSQPARRIEGVIFWAFRLATYFVLACGLAVFANIFFKGGATVFQARAPFVNFTFLTEAPESLYVFEWQGRKVEMGDREFREFRERNPEAAKVKTESYVYSAGGIFPCIVGTVLLVIGSMAIALLLGVCAAIYLNEYARDGRFIRFVRLAILNLAGVPSIVFGLFGFGMFVIFFGWNVSLLAGWFTLAFMVLPVVITASEESLKAVPRGFREGSLALGATKWQTIRKNVLPYAMPGILTSSILGIARVAGETAPIMFTAAYVVRDKLPWDVERSLDFFFQGVMALPYHIYVVSSKIPQNEYTEKVQYGTAFVFLAIVALIATSSILLRSHLRNRYKW